MAKVLLVIDDYQELVSMEALLRKLGFDVVGVANEYSISEQFITFHPDILIVYGKDNKVSTLSVGQKVANSKSFKGKVALIFPEGKKPRPMELADLRMDVLLEAPVEEKRIVTMLAGLCNISLDQLSSKLTRSFEDSGEEAKNFGLGAKDEDQVRVGGREESAQEKSMPGPKALSAQQKSSGGKYDDKFQDEELPPRTFKDRTIIRKKWSEARANAPGQEESQDLFEQKKHFTRALFRKDDK